MGVLKLLVATFVILLVSVERHQVVSECCRVQEIGKSSRLWGKGVTSACLDGAVGQRCCGQGECNIFCCNCDGGCRTGNGARGRFVRSIPDNMGVNYDVNGARQLLLSGQCGNYSGTLEEFINIFNKFDKNGDAKLSYDEMNG